MGVVDRRGQYVGCIAHACGVGMGVVDRRGQ